MGKSQREKGKRGEREWAKFLQAHDIPAMRTGYHQVHKGSSEAADVKHPFFVAEVKRHKAFLSKRVTDALGQVLAHARKDGGIGYVAARNDGDDWHVILRGDDFARVVRDYTAQAMAVEGVLAPQQSVRMASDLSVKFDFESKADELDLEGGWFSLQGDRRVSFTRFGKDKTLVTSIYFINGVEMRAQRVVEKPYDYFVRLLVEFLLERKRMLTDIFTSEGEYKHIHVWLIAWPVRLRDGWWVVADRDAEAAVELKDGEVRVTATIFGTGYEVRGKPAEAAKLVDDIVLRVAGGSPEELAHLYGGQRL